MALPEGLTKAEIELLGLLPNEADRDTLGKLFLSNPVLRERNEGYLRQADYDRNMNGWKAEKAKIEEAHKAAIETVNKWKDWEAKARPAHEATLAANRQLQQRTEVLQTEIARLSEGREIDMDEKELNATLDRRFNEFKAAGITLNPDQVRAVVVEEVSKSVAAGVKEQADALEKRFFDETFPQTNRFTTRLTRAMIRHNTQFHEELDEEALLKYMQDNKAQDPLTAWEQMTSERREADKLKAQTAANDKLVSDRVNEELSRRGLPSSGLVPGPSLEETGVLQTREIHPEILPVKDGDVRVGSGRLASLAAAALAQEGK